MNAYTFDYTVHEFYDTVSEHDYTIEAVDQVEAQKIFQGYLAETYDDPITITGVEIVEGADHRYISLEIFMDAPNKNPEK